MGKKIVNWIVHLLPGYGWACFLCLLLIQTIVFCPTRFLLPYMDKLDLSTVWVARIPFRPVWVLVYLLSYASCGVTFFLLFRQRKEHVYRNSAAYLLTLILTFACFMLMPAQMERPEVPGTDFFSWLTRLVYVIDQPNNLFPSLHVVCSYYCWRAVYDTEGIPRWYRRFNFVYLVLVCCSVLFVKQHVLVDVPAGVVVSEIPLQLARRFRWERLGYAIEERIRRKKGQ